LHQNVALAWNVAQHKEIVLDVNLKQLNFFLFNFAQHMTTQTFLDDGLIATISSILLDLFYQPANFLKTVAYDHFSDLSFELALTVEESHCNGAVAIVPASKGVLDRSAFNFGKSMVANTCKSA
jgi:hypothetical protein